MSQSTPTPDTTARTETAETVTVPRYATNQMYDAADAAHRRWFDAGLTSDPAQDIWQSMLAVAPALSPQHPVGVREVALAVLAHRQGDLPSQGWLRDNSASRKALAELADAISHPPAQDAPDPDRILKDALFACLKTGAVAREYGGVLVGDGMYATIRLSIDPSPPLPEADGEVVALVAKLRRAEKADNDTPSWVRFTCTEAADKLVAALQERDEANDSKWFHHETVGRLSKQLYDERAAREKAEQVAAGLREDILTSDFIKEVTQEYLSHRGERPWRILRGGQELWEAHIDAIKSGLVSALRASTEEGKTATPSVTEEEAGRG